MVAPIYQLTCKNVPFDWNEECQKAFQSVKQELISNRLITYFNPKLPLIVSCDASPVGLGAVLAHKMPSGKKSPLLMHPELYQTVKEITVKLSKRA